MMTNQTPAFKTPNKNKTILKDPIQVYCRIKPSDSDNVCLRMVSNSIVQMSSSDSSTNYLGEYFKETEYVFSYVFDQNTTQKMLFDHVALPLIDGLLHSKNGLLFVYGVTGSGKTFTMTGTPQECGIMPRALDVIFNSISHLQSKTTVFKLDNFNGFEIRSEEGVKKNISNELQAYNLKTPIRRMGREGSWVKRAAEQTKIENVDEDYVYAVFVTYVEVYNKFVYDLLDENFEDISVRERGPQSKGLRVDGAKQVYVYGVTEVEVTSAEEAFDMLNKGMRRKHIAHTSLNTESSRSHSVFTIRLVKAPLNTCTQDKKSISVTQLSFVDLAGSERTCRTNTSGQRLREAGNINNSLMCLRTCLETLRENQKCGTNKIVPYRDSKLTHLLKNFFDGECIIQMIVCASPSPSDYDENIHVMKFAEKSQEVLVAKPTPARSIDNFSSCRHRANKEVLEGYRNHNVRRNLQAQFTVPQINIITDKENAPNEWESPPVFSLASQIPDILCLEGPEDEKLVSLIMLLKIQIDETSKYKKQMQNKGQVFRKLLVENEEEHLNLKEENTCLLRSLDDYKDQVARLESQLKTLKFEAVTLKKQNIGCERLVKRLQENLEMRKKDKKIVLEEFDKQDAAVENDSKLLNITIRKPNKFSSSPSGSELSSNWKRRSLSVTDKDLLESHGRLFWNQSPSASLTQLTDLKSLPDKKREELDFDSD